MRKPNRKRVADLPPAPPRETLNDRLAAAGLPPARPGEKLRDYAARKAGFSSTTQSRNAALVVAQGAPNVVAAINTGELAISTAADVVRFVPLEDQRGLTIKELKAMARLYRRARAEAKAADRMCRDLLRAGGPDEHLTPEQAAAAIPDELVETVLARAEKRLRWLWMFLELMREGRGL